MDDFKKKKLSLLPLEKRLMLDAALPVIANQVLWLDAADVFTIRDTDGDSAAAGTGGANNGFGGTVATWVDKSGSGNNVTNAVAGEQPLYAAQTLNARNLITFDGTNDRLYNLAAGVTGSEFTSFVVFNRTTAVGRDAVFEMAAGASRNGLYVNEANSGHLGYYNNGTFVTFASPYTAGTYTMTAIEQNATVINAWNNASSEISTTGSSRTSTTGIYVGDDSTSGDQLQGNIAELIIYNRALTAEERHDVENYLANKWGLTETNINPIIAVNTGTTGIQTGTVVIDTAHLSSTDADNTDSRLIYTVTDAVDHGILRNTNTNLILGLGATFNQGDIDNGYIAYTHDGTANFADAFTFSVSDRYASTATQVFNLTITPNNLAPVIEGWTSVASENFESGATGWSDNTTTADGTYLTQFLGRHSLEGGVQNTFKTFALSGTQDQAIVTFDFYEIDSWDGETFRVFINDALVYNVSFSQGVYQVPVSGSSGAVSWEIQNLTPFNTHYAFSNSFNDQSYRFVMTVNSNAGFVKLGFSSTLDQAVGDEAWGVDNVHIYEVRNGGVPGPMQIAENSINGKVVGTVRATDPNVTDTLSYTITGGTGVGMFAINAATGVITVINSASLNYEVTPSYTLTVQVSDNGSPVLSDSETITINVIDIPENTAPTIPATGPFSVSEAAAVATAVGTVAATDAESHTITYSITAGNTAGIFAINAATGAITVASTTNLNYEATPSYTLTIRAQDNGFGLLASTRNVIINVTNSNEAPSFSPIQGILNTDPTLRYSAATGNFYKFISGTVNLATAQVGAGALLNGVAGHLATITSAAENTFVTSIITAAAWIGGSDATVEGSWRWTTGPEAGQLFWLGAAAGAAQGGFYTNWAAGQPDDGGSNEDGMQMQVNGTWNDIPVGNSYGYVIEWEGVTTMASLQNGPYTIAENSVIGSVVGSAHASDPDVGDTRTFNITGGTGSGLFAINGVTGQITSTGALNYEAATSYTLNLRIQDAGGLFDTTTVTINIGDVNEAPTLNPTGPFNFNENVVISTAVTTMTATDPDGGQTLTYSIQSGNTNGMFAINGATGVLTFAGSPNYEAVNAYSLVIRVTDNGTGALTSQQTVAVTINPVNEAPTFDPILTLTANDPTLHYNATTGNFYRYVTTGVNLAGAQAASNAALLNGIGGHLVTVTSAIENAQVASLISNAVWIDGSDAAIEGEWRFTGGPTAGQMFWLGAAAGSAQNGFYTNWNGGEPNNSGNEDGIQMYVGGAWNDINTGNGMGYVIEWEGAAVLASLQNGPYTVAENVALGTSVGFAHAFDPDLGDVKTFSVTGGSGAGLFAINGSTGEITVTGALNYEASSSYTLNLRVQDIAGLFDTRTVTINITDLNEVPVLAAAGPFAHDENIAPGTLVTTMSAIDQDGGQTLTYSIQSGNTGGMFALNAMTGALTFAGSPDFETVNSYSLVIRVTDDGAGTLYAEQTVMISINDLNEVPVLAPAGPFVIAENTAAGTLLTTMTATDQDGGQTLSYSIQSGNTGGMFAINAATGALTFAGSPNFEVLNGYSLVIRVTDNGTGALYAEQTVGITITDANDTPTALDLSYNRITENSAVGTPIGMLTTTDEDPADTHTYSIVINPGSKFIIVGNELRSAGPIDYELNQSFGVVIRTDDGNGGIFDQAFTIYVNDQQDTFTPPPVPVPPVVATQANPQDSVDVKTVSLIRASLQGGEMGQALAFYGLDNSHQILRENMTFKIMDLADVSPDEIFSDEPVEQDNADADRPIEDTDTPDRFTNLRQALKFFEQLEESGDKTDSSQDKAASPTVRHLPHTGISQQFVDVLTYHEQRQARLREALLNS